MKYCLVLVAALLLCVALPAAADVGNVSRIERFDSLETELGPTAGQQQVVEELLNSLEGSETCLESV